MMQGYISLRKEHGSYYGNYQRYSDLAVNSAVKKRASAESIGDNSDYCHEDVDQKNRCRQEKPGSP
ncbi:MAG: hypothetical protein J5I94_12690 [Phaeodactylibacter sp.]|nr:hypothetical protein [Phaeodactylibacter sp.]